VIRTHDQATAERGGSRGATAGTDRAGCGPILEVPRSFLSTLKARFFSSARARLETALLAGRSHRGMGSRQRLWKSITGSSSIRRLKDARSKVDLHELSPVGRRCRCFRGVGTRGGMWVAALFGVL